MPPPIPWGITPERLIAAGHCCHVYLWQGKALRVPFQGEEMGSGRVAAEILSGNLGPKIHRSDPESGALLMDLIHPGEKMSDLLGLSREAEDVFVDFVKQMPSAKAFGLTPLSKYINPSIPLAERLLASAPEPRFLHGDLHHENVLWGGDRWWVIDPKGLWGEAAYEVAAFLRNPFSLFPAGQELVDLTETRIDSLSTRLGLDPQRVWGWALADQLSDPPTEGHPWAEYTQALRQLDSRYGF